MELNFLGRGAAFNPKEGNNSAHNNGAVLPATTALECLQRAFEVAVNFAFSRNPNKTKQWSQLMFRMDSLKN